METDRPRRKILGLRNCMTDHPSPSSFSSLQTQISLSTFLEHSQSLQFTPEEKAGTILGSAIITSVILSFNQPHIYTLGM